MSDQPSPTVVALIQARMGSTRLPGKTLADLGGKSLLERIVERVGASRLVGGIVLCTTSRPEDDVLAAAASAMGIGVYRGSADDVLDRFYQAAVGARADVIVRVTADDPFKDPRVIDEVTGHLLSDPALDYVSNTLEPTYPEGLDIEVFTFKALAKAWEEARLPSEREHVTPYIWKHPDRFRIRNVTYRENLSHMRWTIDYPEDLQFAREVYAWLGAGGIFGMDAILILLKQHPEIAGINTGFERNAGYKASVDKEADHI